MPDFETVVLAFLGTAGHVWCRFFPPMAIANVIGASLARGSRSSMDPRSCGSCFCWSWPR